MILSSLLLNLKTTYSKSHIPQAIGGVSENSRPAQDRLLMIATCHIFLAAKADPSNSSYPTTLLLFLVVLCRQTKLCLLIGRRCLEEESDWRIKFYLKHREIKLIFSLWLINSLMKQLFEPYRYQTIYRQTGTLQPGHSALNLLLSTIYVSTVRCISRK